MKLFMVFVYKFYKTQKYPMYLKIHFYLTIIIITAFLSSCEVQTKPDKSIISRFKEIERVYFIESAYEKKFDFILKWNRPVISYSINGVFNDKDITFIKETLNNISTIKGLPKFQFSKGIGDMIFYMPTDPNDVQVLYEDEATAIRGLMQPVLISNDGYFQSVKIYIKPKQASLDTQITIHHELMHALGLMGHPKSSFKQSSALGVRYFTLNNSDTISPIIPKLDSSALILLYNKHIAVKQRKRGIKTLIGLNR